MHKLVALAAGLAGLMLMGPAVAQQTDVAALEAACLKQGPAMLGEAHAGKLVPFCGCLASELSVREQADVDILTKDLLGEATQADKAAYGDFETLEESARDSLNTCFRREGMEDMADPAEEEQGEIPFVTPDMTAFDATCRSSSALLNWMSSGKLTPEEARSAVCGCLVEEFPLNFQQSTVDILAKSFDGTLTEADKAGYLNFETFAKRAEDIMGQCIARAGL